MKYTSEIIVDVPRTVFIEKLDNPENMVHWQRGLVKYKPLSSNPGEEGAQMELHYKMGKRELVMIETILKRNLPDEMHATYDAKGVHNIQHNYFEIVSPTQTRWRSESEFQFSGFFMKFMAFLMPGAFKKQSMKYLRDFKAFAEEGKKVSNS
ncbi:SRPBCC family protein [Lentiprolixibacter aurantiacus]|uniref:SRPBCC family protein n=1 Tax=Lentiprolixibacter aurantiacus TaxID=2993939 RepID=A0AAE3MMM2_9FLAO|nr:SRPBCC family protein [Lentiprolixibacter aurantiacus]MCX2720141.1 SRPBCC family protein [Lentiprolixibacter aurantiacus]